MYWHSDFAPLTKLNPTILSLNFEVRASSRTISISNSVISCTGPICIIFHENFIWCYHFELGFFLVSFCRILRQYYNIYDSLLIVCEYNSISWLYNQLFGHFYDFINILDWNKGSEQGHLHRFGAHCLWGVVHDLKGPCPIDLTVSFRFQFDCEEGTSSQPISISNIENLM